MKKIFNLIVMFGLLVTGFVSCGNPASSGFNGNSGNGEKKPPVILTAEQKMEIYRQYLGKWHSSNINKDYEFLEDQVKFDGSKRNTINGNILFTFEEFMSESSRAEMYQKQEVAFEPVLVYEDDYNPGKYVFYSAITVNKYNEKEFKYQTIKNETTLTQISGSSGTGGSGNLSSFAGTYSFSGSGMQKSGSWTFKDDGTYTYSGQSQSAVGGTYTLSGSSVTMHTTSGSLKIDETLNISANGNQVTFTTTETQVSHIFQVYFNATTSKSLTLTKS